MIYKRYFLPIALLLCGLPTAAQAQEIKDDTIRVSPSAYPMLSFMGEIREQTPLCSDYRIVTSTTTITIRPNTAKPVKICRLIVTEGSKGTPRQHTFVLVFDKDADPSEQIHDYSTKNLMERRIEFLEKSREAAAEAAKTAAAPQKEPAKQTSKEPAREAQKVLKEETVKRNIAEESGGEEKGGATVMTAEEIEIQEIPTEQLSGRVKQKVNAFYKTCEFLCAKTDVDGTIKYGMKLFDNDDEKLVSTTNSKTNARSAKKIRSYFVHLSQLSYKRVEMTASDIKFVSKFHKGPDNKWHASAVIIQDFKGYNDYNVLAYKDQTTKVFDITIATFDETKDGKTVTKFDIYLGNISVTNTPA